ncbi:MAG: hypothetical protein M3Q33_15320, partial [Acidobacteriota bacterium]|nr:hypothetical protein [Acidobacteriota bacterium]
IKVIKQKDVAVSALAKTQSMRQPKQEAAFGEEKIERRLRRKMAETVSNWISERREKNRAEEILAIRRIFGSESLFGKTVSAREF